MSQCNVDFFDRSLNLVHHDIIDSPCIDEDYLTPVTNSIEIGVTDKVKNGYLVYIKGTPADFLGIVTDVKDDEYLTTVTFKPMVSLFDHPIMFDTNYQTSAGGTKSLEEVINLYISRYHAKTGGSLGNDTDSYLYDETVLDIGTASSTMSWGFNLKSDVEDMHHCKIGFQQMLLNRAMTKHGVVVRSYIQYNNGEKKLVFRTGAIDGSMILDADREEVKVKTLQIQNAADVTNKLEIWNSKNFTEKVYYYLHPDGTYDTNKSSNRIEPVKIDVLTAQEERDEDDIVTKTFAEAARSEAASTYGSITWTNLIELEVLPTDNAIQPLTIPIGQKVNIYYKGTMYSTILTGRKMGDVITLVFGTVRLDLTKKLKQGGK